MKLVGNVDYDSFLETYGGIGRYQILLFCLLALTSFKVAIDAQSLVLGTFTPKFWCTSSNASINVNKTSCSISPTNNSTCTSWTYDTSFMSRTIVTEFNLVCDSAYLVPLFQTVVFASIGIARFLDPVSDIIGRRKLLIGLMMYDMILTPIQAFVPTLTAQFVFRVIRGLGDALNIQGLLFLLELVSTKYRLNFSCNYWIFWCSGYSVSAMLGKYLHDWRYIQIAAMIVAPFYIISMILLVESPRWLLVKGRKQDAIKVLRKIAKFNNHKIPDSAYDDLRVETNTQTGRIQDAFKSRTMAMKTLIAWFVIWTFAFSYTGLLLDLNFASDDIFINILAMGLVELPASPLSWLMGDKLGRRSLTFTILTLTAIIIIGVPHIPKGEIAWLRTTAAILGKFLVSMGYCIGAAYMMELQPTCIRNAAMFPSRILAAISFIVSPYVLHLNTVAFWIPSLIIGLNCFVAALTILALPETLNTPLPQTIPEADLLTRGDEANYQKHLEELHRKDFDDGVTVEMMKYDDFNGKSS